MVWKHLLLGESIDESTWSGVWYVPRVPRRLLGHRHERRALLVPRQRLARHHVRRRRVSRREGPLIAFLSSLSSFLFLFLSSSLTEKSRPSCRFQRSRFQLKEFLNSQRDTRAMEAQENDTHAPFSQITNADSRIRRRARGHRFVRTCCTAATDEGGSATARFDSESSLPVRRGPGVLLDATHFGAGSWSCI